MTRPTTLVRQARPADLPAVMQMWGEMRALGSRLERVLPGPSEDGVLDRLRVAEDDLSSRAMVATVDGEVVGMMLLSCTPYAPFFEQNAVHVHYLHVRDGFRRRGVGKALLAAATTFADEVGAEHILTSVLPQLRETNRFYARLGFGQVVVRRAVPVNILRRRLAAEGVSACPEVVARRRTLRRWRAAMARVGE